MRRRGPILALGAVALLGLAPATDGAQERTSCQKLSAKHDLAPARRVKLVELNDGDRTVLKGCVLPAGRVFTVDARYTRDGETGDYLLRQVVGHELVANSDFRTRASKLHYTYVFDLKTGRTYTVASRCRQTQPGECFGKNDADETAVRVRVNGARQAAAVLTTKGSELVTVVGYSPRGNRRILDTGTRNEIPPSSLQVDGHTASWTNNGAHMSARLPSVTDCQRLTAKHDLARAHKAKLVERKNDDGGKDLVGCVLPDGKVSVVASQSTISGQKRSYEVLQVAGHEVLVRGKLINPYGAGVSTYVFDLKRAKSHTLAESCFDEHGAACDQTYARRAFVNAQGQAAVLLRTDGESALQVLGFASTGESRVLDTGGPSQIPKSSLSLDGHVVRWTHSGTPRSATLSG